MKALPRTFFKTSLVNPINLSQKPPYQGALLGMNFHSTPVLAKVLVSKGEEKRAFNSSAADKNVEPLSERTKYGRDHLLHSTVRLVTISRCTPRLTAQVNRQMYTLVSPGLPLTYNAPVKSMPVTSKGIDCCTRVVEDPVQCMADQPISYRSHTSSAEI